MEGYIYYQLLHLGWKVVYTNSLLNFPQVFSLIVWIWYTVIRFVLDYLDNMHKKYIKNSHNSPIVITLVSVLCISYFLPVFYLLFPHGFTSVFPLLDFFLAFYLMINPSFKNFCSLLASRVSLSLGSFSTLPNPKNTPSLSLKILPPLCTLNYWFLSLFSSYSFLLFYFNVLL